ncbi:unnamed protein product [Cuscuta campestris]|uniref:CCHC-type domain-containing protein n=1 Tax=Cuscuta campestris TaxID=132261 RepID=A0A484NAK1_9ASTE|nr:unnamed protein product [Cuscuta campestris]
MNYMMHDLDKPLPELLKMLQTAEENLTKGKGASVLMVQGGKGKPKKGIKIKARTVGKPKSKSTSSATQKPIGGVAKGKCHHCGKAGHWRRNCKTYLATKKKEGTTSSSENHSGGYALSTAIYTLNRVPTKAVEGTPYQLWTGKCPVMSHLKIWGCEAYVKRLMMNGKLDAKSDKCFFVGYPKETQGYSFYHPIDKKVFVARNGVFLEKEFLSIATSGRKIELEEIRDDKETTALVLEHELEEQTVVPQHAQDTQEPRRSNRLRTQPERTKDAFLVYGGKDELSIVGYTDASFQNDRDDFKSQAGYVICLNGGAVTWKSYKQDTTADSTIEEEYMAAAEAAKEGVWLKNFITELGVVPSIKNPIPLFCDNNGAIAQAKEPQSHQKTKHIVRRYHIIREIVARGDVEICKIGTDDNIGDLLTKALGKPKHESHTWSMGIQEMLDCP